MGSNVPLSPIDEKIKIYDKGVQITSGEGVYDLLVSYRSGDMWAPRVEQAEALKVELSYFLDCIRQDETPINDGVAGLRVVQLLEAADLDAGGPRIAGPYRFQQVLGHRY